MPKKKFKKKFRSRGVNNKRYSKINIKYLLKNNFNKTNKYFEHFSSIISNKALYSFLDYYNIHKNYLNKKNLNLNTNYNMLIHKSYFSINLNKININKNIFENFNTNINFINKLYLFRENIELGYNDNNINNLNKKYCTYYYTKIFKLKKNNYKKNQITLI
jgi:hypothetical protein